MLEHGVSKLEGLGSEEFGRGSFVLIGAEEARQGMGGKKISFADFHGFRRMRVLLAAMNSRYILCRLPV